MLRLIITEKPSVAKNIADALKIKTGKTVILRVMDISSHGHSDIYSSSTMQKIMMKRWQGGILRTSLSFHRVFDTR